MELSWIWIDDGRDSENERVCFAREFTLHEGAVQSLKLRVSAVTRYIAYLDGEEIARGPLRGGRGVCGVDEYELASALRGASSRGAAPEAGCRHLLCFRVWHYKWSTYQSIGRPQGALAFELWADGLSVARSDAAVRCARDAGHLVYAPKRNVNLGFTDYYDARRMRQDWLCEAAASRDWAAARPLDFDPGALIARPIREFQREKRYAQALLCDEETAGRSQQWSVNTRRAFFGARADADETVFSGFIGVELEAPRAMRGRVVFPNRTWNGLIGDFTIGGRRYAVSNECRDITVELRAGRQLFLLQLSGKFDDLYCHIEWIFPEEIRLCARGEGEAPFFAIGPTERLCVPVDGFREVLGGLNEYNRFAEHSPAHEAIFACASLEALRALGCELRRIDARDCYRDLYLLSKVMSDAVVRRYALPNADNLGILWDNHEETLLGLPREGDSRRILLDFGRIHIGSVNFTLWARRGTVLEFYGFENYYRHEIDYTIGLNNALRYVCDEGWQSYRCMTRMGFRYLLVILRAAEAPVRIRDLHMLASTYSPTQAGSFECSDEELNRIWQMCRDTHLLSMDDCFSDSPTYEQAFWQGDGQINELIHAYLFGDYDYIFHSQRIAAGGRENTPLVNALAPTDWTTAIPLWTMNWIISVFQARALSGRSETARALYPAMRDTLRYYERFIGEDGAFLINAWNMLDWAPLDIDNYAVVTGQQAALVHCYRRLAGLAEEMGEAEAAADFSAQAARLLRYLDEVLWNPEKQMYHDAYLPERGLAETFSIQTHTMLYLYDAISDPERRARVGGYLLDPPQDFIAVGSPFMLAYLYECWAQQGRLREIFADIKRRWLEMLRYNSNTCWEVFPGFYENARTRSYCHGWSASPAYFMLKLLSAVRALEPDYSSVEIALPDLDLRWCRIVLPTPQGRIFVDWERGEDGPSLLLRLPETIHVRNEKEAERFCKITRLATAPETPGAGQA